MASPCASQCAGSEPPPFRCATRNREIADIGQGRKNYAKVRKNRKPRGLDVERVYKSMLLAVGGVIDGGRSGEMGESGEGRKAERKCGFWERFHREVGCIESNMRYSVCQVVHEGNS